MNSISELENLNTLILSQILTEDIYIIPEAPSAGHTKTESTPKKSTEEKPVLTPSVPKMEEKPERTAPVIKKAVPATKDIIIVLDKAASAEELEFLSKILAALKMTVAEVSIMTFSEFSIDMNFKKLISFNVNLEKLIPAIKTEKYGVKATESAKFLSADSLPELTSDVKKKKQLWDALQQMFSLK